MLWRDRKNHSWKIQFYEDSLILNLRNIGL